MSELKRFGIVGKYADEEVMYEFRPDGECYDADEVDKMIEELEENHKKEVGQLLIANREQAIAANRLRDSMEQAIRNQKYKRCLAMAELCRTSALYEKSPDAAKYCKWWLKWYERWLKLAEQFKDASND